MDPGRSVVRFFGSFDNGEDRLLTEAVTVTGFQKLYRSANCMLRGLLEVAVNFPKELAVEMLLLPTYCKLPTSNTG